MYTVGQPARICGVSTKTLRHYDAVGLFCPSAVGEGNGYRYYVYEQIATLRRILFLRELGLGVETIREMADKGALSAADRLVPVLEERATSIRRELEQNRLRLERIDRELAVLRGERVQEDVQIGEVKCVTLPGLEFVGIRRVIGPDGFAPLFEDLRAKLRAGAHTPVSVPMMLFYDDDYDPERMDVEIGRPVKGRGERLLPGGSFAVLPVVGRYEDTELWSAAFSTIFDWDQRNGDGSGPAAG